MTLQRHAPTAIEMNALAFQEQPLGERSGSVRPHADHSARVDHAMPRHRCAGRQRMERVADEPRLSGETRERGYLAVCRYAPARDAPNDRENRVVSR